MGVLSRDAINAVAKTAPVEFNVPEWGGSVLLRYLPASAKDSYEMWAADIQKRLGLKAVKDFRSKLVALCLVDADGKRLFGDDHITELAKQPAFIVDRLYKECERMNHMGSQAEKDEAAVQAAKNSESGQTEDSPTV